MTTFTKQRVIPGLGYLGVIPFAVAAYFVLQGGQLLQFEPAAVFVGYSSVILAFLGGSLWGRSQLLDDSAITVSLLIASNLIALLGWASLSFAVFNYGVAVSGLILGYVMVLFIEHRCARRLFGSHADSYLDLRRALTSLVVLTHLLVLLAIL